MKNKNKKSASEIARELEASSAITGAMKNLKGISTTGAMKNLKGTNSAKDKKMPVGAKTYMAGPEYQGDYDYTKSQKENMDKKLGTASSALEDVFYSIKNKKNKKKK